MIKIDYPEHEFKIVKEGTISKIFDPFRKKWCVLTPEEWVRQNTLMYLTQVANYPSSLMAIEKEISLGELKKRCDIVVYDPSGMPWMIIECKEAKVPVNAKVLDQVLRYHSSLPVPYIMITNGNNCFCFRKSEGHFDEIFTMPVFGL